MEDRKWRLQQLIRNERQIQADPAKLEETIQKCIQIVHDQNVQKEEPRLQFWGYLSAVFRFDGIPILGLQAVIFLLVCLVMGIFACEPKSIPMFMPLFVLVPMPVMFRGQYYKMSEIEAVTRTSGAQMMLARLILAGAANLLGMTGLLSVEVYCQNAGKELEQMILYCIVPYLICMILMLRMIRLRKKVNMAVSTAGIFGFCVFWGGLAKAVPWLYQTSAIGIWIIAAVFFALFFIKEIYYVVETRKEGKMYGIIV